MFQRFLKSKLRHADPQIRARAYAELSLEQPELTEGLLKETHPDVLLAIIQRSTDLSTLHKHALVPGSPQVADAARQRIVEIANAAEPVDQDAWFEIFQHGARDRWSQLSQAGSLLTTDETNEKRTLAILRAFENHQWPPLGQAEIAALILGSQSSAVRREAARFITEQEHLNTCCQGIKDRDKTTYRELKTRLDHLRQLEEFRLQAKELIGRAQELDNLTVEAQNESIAIAIARDRNFAEQVEKISSDAGDLSEILELRNKSDALHEVLEKRISDARQNLNKRQELIEQIGSLRQTPEQVELTEEKFEQYYSQQWSAIPDHSAADNSQYRKTLEQTINAVTAYRQHQKSDSELQSWLSRWEEKVSNEKASVALQKKLQQEWLQLSKPTQPDQQDQSHERYEKMLTDLNAQIEKDQRIRAKHGDKVTKQLAEFQEHLENGDLKQALPVHDRLRQRLASVPLDSALKANTEKQLKIALPKLDEYRKWRHFGTVQARENLIGQANALLADPPDSPKVLARQVKDFREAWKKLDQDDGRATEELWTKFNSACKEAYKPARKHFRELAKDRKDNESTRREIIQNLTGILESTDWSAPDWSSVTKSIGELRRQWVKAGTVDYKVKKQLDREYLAVTNKLDEALNDEREGEHRRRTLMIAKLKQHVEQDQIKDVAEIAKKMQRQWRPNVQSDRKTERQLWNDFRGLCDQVFSSLKEQSDADKKEWQADLAERQSICTQVEELLSQQTDVDDQQLNAAQGQLDQLVRRWKERSAIPRGVFVKVDQKFNQARKQFLGRVKGYRKTANQKNEKILGLLADVCIQAEQNALAENSEPEAIVEKLNSDWQASGKATGPGAKALTRRFEQACKAISGDAKVRGQIEQDLENNLQKRRELCLLGELITELPTPSEYADDRKQLQMKRLTDALQGGGTDKDQELRELVAQWYSLGSVSAEAWPQLSKRFAEIKRAFAVE